jgi:hypothetical protein
MPVFMDQLEKLRLPSQHMTITVHTIEAIDEPSLYLGVASCRRSAVMSNHTEGEEHGHGHGYVEKTFLSAECLWRHFQHIDDASRDAATWLKRHPDTWFANTQHLVCTVHMANKCLCFVVMVVTVIRSRSLCLFSQ